MYSIKSLSPLFSLVISIAYAIAFDNQPVIACVQGVIAKENVLPLSVFWYHPNFTGNDWFSVHYSNTQRKFEDYYRIESYTGFHELPGIAVEHGEVSGFDSDGDHRNFIKYLERSFARYAHQRRFWRYPLSSIWYNDRRLIISYDHHTYNSSDFMWPPINQYWSNAQTINRLHTYFNKLHSSVISYYAPYATMVQLTHSFTTLTQDLFQGGMSLRHWGERIGKYIPRWYTEEWNETANIIAVDFYQASGIVDLAIQLNEERSRYPH